jgi:predicted enzyme related to lactoylglutathione lyase
VISEKQDAPERRTIRDMKTDVPFGLSRLHQIAQPVRDLNRAVAFYHEVLGVPHLFTLPNLAFFDCNGVRLMLSPPEGGQEFAPGSALYFRVEDIGAAYRTLTERGISFEGPPHIVGQTGTHNVWLAGFRDTEGNFVALMSEVPLP